MLPNCLKAITNVILKYISEQIKYNWLVEFWKSVSEASFHFSLLSTDFGVYFEYNPHSDLNKFPYSSRRSLILLDRWIVKRTKLEETNVCDITLPYRRLVYLGYWLRRVFVTSEMDNRGLLSCLSEDNWSLLALSWNIVPWDFLVFTEADFGL